MPRHHTAAVGLLLAVCALSGASHVPAAPRIDVPSVSSDAGSGSDADSDSDPDPDPGSGSSAGATSGDYTVPVAVPFTVVRAFVPPPTRWSAGHRWVDLAAASGSVVLAPADGVVTFAGPVAGRDVLTIRHTGGRRSSLEPVVALVTVGATVLRGQPVGALQGGAPTHCAPAACVHWGVREGETYVDPMTLVLGVGPIVLLPLAG